MDSNDLLYIIFGVLGILYLRRNTGYLPESIQMQIGTGMGNSNETENSEWFCVSTNREAKDYLLKE